MPRLLGHVDKEPRSAGKMVGEVGVEPINVRVRAGSLAAWLLPNEVVRMVRFERTTSCLSGMGSNQIELHPHVRWLTPRDSHPPVSGVTARRYDYLSLRSMKWNSGRDSHPLSSR